MKFQSTPYKQFTIKPSKDKRNVLVKFDKKGFVTVDDKDLIAKLQKADGVKEVTAAQEKK